jgi:hypothetical protein
MNAIGKVPRCRMKESEVAEPMNLIPDTGNASISAISDTFICYES